MSAQPQPQDSKLLGAALIALGTTWASAGPTDRATAMLGVAWSSLETQGYWSDLDPAAGGIALAQQWLLRARGAARGTNIEAAGRALIAAYDALNVSPLVWGDGARAVGWSWYQGTHPIQVAAAAVDALVAGPAA